MTYQIIQTGSDGNCTVVDGQIAIDIGVPWYKIKPYLRTLRYVLLTHRHSDHFNKGTVKQLARFRPTIRWVCGEWMVPNLIGLGIDKRFIDVLPMNTWYAYMMQDRAVRVSAFETYHDAPNCGWRIWKSPQDSIFYATDLGHLEGIEAKGYGTYLLEANYREAELAAREEEKLEQGQFSYESRAAEYHLSEEQAMEWLAENAASYSEYVLMHQHKERRGMENGMVRSAPDTGETS